MESWIINLMLLFFFNTSLFTVTIRFSQTHIFPSPAQSLLIVIRIHFFPQNLPSALSRILVKECIMQECSNAVSQFSSKTLPPILNRTFDILSEHKQLFYTAVNMFSHVLSVTTISHLPDGR